MKRRRAAELPDEPVEPFKPARPFSDFLRECKNRYSAIITSKMAAERADEARRKSENAKFIELRRLFGGRRQGSRRNVGS
jgi:hypothetical protein